MDFLFSGHLAWLLFALVVVGVVHELGHALVARLAGYRVSSVGFGHSTSVFSPLLRLHRGRTVFYFGIHWWAGGRCVAVPASPNASKAWLYSLGGVLAQGVLAGVLMLEIWPAEGAEVVSGLNALVMAFNLCPWRVRGVQSDGWTALCAWPGWGDADSGGETQETLDRILKHEQSVGASLGQEWCQEALTRHAGGAEAEVCLDPSATLRTGGIDRIGRHDERNERGTAALAQRLSTAKKTVA